MVEEQRPDSSHTFSQDELVLLAERLAHQVRAKAVIDLGTTSDVLPDMLRAHDVRAWSAADLTTAVSIGNEHGCDVAVTLGLKEDLDEEDVRATVETLTALAPRILVGSLTTLPSWSWFRLLAERGFYLDADFIRQVPFLGVAMFTRAEGDFHGAAAVDPLRRAVEERDRRIVELTGRLLAVEATVTWRLREHARSAINRLPFPARKERAVHAMTRAVEVLLDEGVSGVAGKVVDKLKHRSRARSGSHSGGSLDEQYERWLQVHSWGPEDGRRAAEEQERFLVRPLVTVVILPNRMDTGAVRESVESVHRQIYPNWELLVVDARDSSCGQSDASRNALPGTRGAQRLSATSLVAALPAAGGELIGLLTAGDRLAEQALFEVVRWLNVDDGPDLIYSDEDEFDAQGRRHPFFKPGWSPDLLLSLDYISRFCVFRRRLLDALVSRRGRVNDEEVHDEYDLILQLTEVAHRVGHIPKILYHRRADRSVGGDESGRRVVEKALQRRGQSARVEMTRLPGSRSTYRRVRYSVPGRPLVSIIIPTRDRGALLRACLATIADRTEHEQYEIVVLDNESCESEALRVLAQPPSNARVFSYPGHFNYSAINNFGARQARGEYLLFLNNDIQVIDPGWLTAMLEQAQRPEVGAVGAKLLYPDLTIQHAGVVLGVPGTAGHAFRHLPDDTNACYGLPQLIRNCSAVTGACLLMRHAVFEEVGGFDEHLRVDLNDVDLCLRIRQRGYLIVYTPVARLYHYEGATRRRLTPSRDQRYFNERWREVLKGGDPYYNPNLTVSREDWSLRL